MLKKLKEESGFTLIEMMIVLMIISVILLIAVPNMTQNNTVAQEKGCDATMDLLQAQVGAYQIEKGEAPSSLTDLQGFVEKTTISDGKAKCPDNKTELELIDGKVKKINPS
ncbi:competence type IV pilus major pilin ComGC [Anaerobacillus sp. MEB173]|uniref:competence type IV pilus major pilin ComGC n=1 Tax=Anaerobacillus sp. MEB173 TaxID=3383345 RepID=UPI003F8DA2E1